MVSLPLKIGRGRRAQTVTVQVDASRFERLAAVFGFFNPGFLSSVDRAEKDYKAGRVRKITSFSQLDD
ncbi:MAG: hypothetical protein AAB776_02125 [Patescibacteria group bacterium]